MTGHHGWGYGQDDGRRRPQPAATQPHSSRPACPGGFLNLQLPRSRTDPVPTLLRPPEPGPPAGPQPRFPSAPRKVSAVPGLAPPPASDRWPSASCRRLRAAPDCRACWLRPGRRTHASTRSARRVEVARGSGGGAGGRGGAWCAGVCAGSARGERAETSRELDSAWARARCPRERVSPRKCPGCGT